MSETIREARKAARYFARHGFDPTREDSLRFLAKTADFENADTPRMDAAVKWMSALPEPKGSPDPAPPLGWQYMMATYVLAQLDGIDLGRQTLITVPRKQGKTSFAAKLALGVMRFTPDNAAQIYSVATKEAQARLVWQDATNMLRRLSPLMLSEAVPDTPRIVDKLAPEDHGSKGRPRSRKHDRFLLRQRRIHLADDPGTTWEFLGKDSGGMDGLFPSLVVIDEAAVVADDVYQVMVSSDTGLAGNYFHIVCISTMNYNPDGWFTKHILSPEEVPGVSRLRWLPPCDPNTGESLLGKHNTPFADYHYESERTWRKLCPAWGILVERKRYRELAMQARLTDSGRVEFLRKRINSPGISETQDMLSPAQARRACNAAHREKVEATLRDAHEVVVGVDLSMTRDITGVAVLGWNQNQNRVIAGKAMGFITEKSFSDRSNRPGGRRLPFFVERGELVIAGTTEIDYELVAEQVRQWVKQYRARKIIADKMTYGMTFRKLLGRDMGARIEDLSSRTDRRAACNFFLSLLKEGSFISPDNEMLVWEMAGNAMAVEFPDGSVEIQRKVKDSPNGIDLLYSCVHAASAFADKYNSTPMLAPPPEADTPEKKEDWWEYFLSTMVSGSNFPPPEWHTNAHPDDDESYFDPQRVAERERQRAEHRKEHPRKRARWEEN